MSEYTLKARTIPLEDNWDVIVVGGGPAGCAAATASAREGARTLLLEATGALGGMGTSGLVPWFCGYRCLTPRGLKNVLVAGRCISTDRQANGSTRIMACCLNTGEAAGIAAALAAAGPADVHMIDTDDLRRRLRQHGAYLP